VSPERQIMYRGRGGEQLGLQQSLYPPAKTIEALSRHNPDAVKDIMDLAKAEQGHVHALARAQLQSEEAQARRDHAARLTGMWFGFLMCAGLLASGVFLIHTGRGWGGYPAVIIAFLTLVGSFLGGRNPPKG